MMYPKPKDVRRPVEAITAYSDGREVIDLLLPEGRAEYMRRIAVMWDRQKRCCCICFQPMRLSESTFEHEAGRGMGGGHRDDRIVLPDGTWVNGAAHGSCNREKGSRRVTYNNGKAGTGSRIAEALHGLVSRRAHTGVSHEHRSRQDGASFLSFWRARDGGCAGVSVVRGVQLANLAGVQSSGREADSGAEVVPGPGGESRAQICCRPQPGAVEGYGLVGECVTHLIGDDNAQMTGYELARIMAVAVVFDGFLAYGVWRLF